MDQSLTFGLYTVALKSILTTRNSLLLHVT